MRRILLVLAAVLIMGASGCSSSGMHSLTDRTNNPDRALESQILNRLRQEFPQFGPSVALSVSNGTVTVFGTPDDVVVRSRITATIKSTAGVTDVKMGD